MEGKELKKWLILFFSNSSLFSLCPFSPARLNERSNTWEDF